MLKVLLGCLIVAFSSFCGYYWAKRYRQRKSFYRQFYEFNQRFLNEIAYYRRPIRDFISKDSYKDEFASLLQSYFSSLNGGKFDLIEFDFLKEDEKVFVYDYFQMLGKGDSSSQKAYYTSIKEGLVKWKITTEEEAKKYEDLYVKLGFLCGLFILILII
jgi:stage III sporulation protein AB